MKQLTILSVLALTIGLSAGNFVYSQSLAEIAKQEREKQKAQDKDKNPKSTKVYTNGDLDKLKGDHVSAVSTETSPAPATTDGEKAENTDSTGQKDGQTADKPDAQKEAPKDEAYWRQRAAAAQQAKDRAKERYDLLLLKQQTLNNKFYNLSDPAQRDALGVELAKLGSEIEQSKQEAIDAAQAVINLQDEGRKAQALPGWLRTD